ncbi:MULTISPECIES: LysE family translocator [unclassified Flavobacterium]|uniref:LysE family translocator n=1 Tax=unclassified Flavobacterium TaxID=196869 RepID=UPI001F1326C2|nr:MULTISPECIES: LysE family translocator [unclassified Flavobacterium]UMY66369.1 LysE family translocator [Flavobacterium sp. HJ-32-4]
MMQDILSAILPGIVLSFMIGPVFFVLLETSVVKGIKAAIIFDLGVILADIVFILIAYLGSYRLIETIKDDPALFIFGGLVLLSYGIITFLKHKKGSKNLDPENPVELARANYFGLFAKGFFLNFINVGVLGFWLMVLLSIGPELELKPSRMLVFFTTLICTYFVVDIGKILLAKQLRNKLNPKNILLIKNIISLILAISGAVLLAKGLFPKQTRIVDEVVNKIEQRADSLNRKP